MCAGLECDDAALPHKPDCCGWENFYTTTEGLLGTSSGTVLCPRVPGGANGERATAPGPAAGAAARTRHRRPPRRGSQDGAAVAERARAVPLTTGPRSPSLLARRRPSCGRMRADSWLRGVGLRSWGRFTRTGGLFRGRSGCGCSGRPGRRSPFLSTVRCFLAEDSEILRILADKGRTGVTVRIALGDPDGPSIAERGEEEGISDATASKIRDALTLYLPLCTGEGRDPAPSNRPVQLDLPCR